MSEAVILREILLALSALKRPDGKRMCAAWRMQSGVFQGIHGGPPSRIGFNGVSDIIGWVHIADKAVFLAVEVKSARGRPTPEQAHFLETVNAAGGIAFVARSAEEACSEVLVRCKLLDPRPSSDLK